MRTSPPATAPDATAAPDAAGEPAMGTRVLRNTMINAIASLSSALVTAIMTPFLIGRLGPASYGVWLLALGVSFSSGYVALADLGLADAAVKLIAEARAIGRCGRGPSPGGCRGTAHRSARPRGRLHAPRRGPASGRATPRGRAPAAVPRASASDPHGRRPTPPLPAR